MAEPPLIVIWPAFEILPPLTVNWVLRLKESLSSESMVKLFIAALMSSMTEEATAFPPSMATFELGPGSPPDHMLPLLQFPVPPSHVSVWANTRSGQNIIKQTARLPLRFVGNI